MDGKPQEIEISSLKMQKTLNNWGETCGNMWKHGQKIDIVLTNDGFCYANGNGHYEMVFFAIQNIIWTLAPCCGHGNMIFKTTVGVQCSNWGQIHGGVISHKNIHIP